jgi:carbon monoxide dehydrogenase subunit G
MSIDIQEKFEIEAPIEAVWKFLNDPESVVGCLPGAFLAEVVDERNFLGRVKVKLGAVSAQYKGKIHFEEVDEEAHVLKMVAEGKDPSGGTAKGQITCSLTTLESGSTEMITDAKIDLTGRVMQVGRGMIKGVSHQLFQQFAKTTKQRLESAQAAAGEGASDAPVAQASEQQELAVLPLLFKTLGAAIANFFKRLFGGSK